MKLGFCLSQVQVLLMQIKKKKKKREISFAHPKSKSTYLMGVHLFAHRFSLISAISVRASPWTTCSSTWRDRKLLSCPAIRSAFPRKGSSAAALSAKQWGDFMRKHTRARTHKHTLPTHLLLVQLNCVSPFAVVHLALRFQTEREKNHLSVCIFAFWFIFSFDASWNATTDLPCAISSLTTSTTCCCPKVSWRKQEITAPIRFKLRLNGPECQRRCCVFHNQQPLTAMKRSGTL